MTTIAVLRQLPETITAHLLLIEGCPFAFTDEFELANAASVGGATWWQDPLDDRIILPGLKIPSNLRGGLDPKSFQFQTDTATFEITDYDGVTVPKFFGNLSKIDAVEFLGERLRPDQDPAPEFIQNTSQGVVNTFGSYIGLEAIGPAGQRGWYSCTPWAPLIGHDHPAFEDPRVVITQPSVGPFLVEGRRITLIKIFFDRQFTGGGGAWKLPAEHWEAAIAGGWSPTMWFGKLKQAGEVSKDNVWSVECDGPESWMERPLNSRASATWWPISSDLNLQDKEKKIGLRLHKAAYYGVWTAHGSDSISYTVDSADVVGSIATAIAAVVAMVGPDGAFSADAGAGIGKIAFGADVVSMAMGAGPGFAGQMFLTLHERVWKLLGYDPVGDFYNADGDRPFFFAEEPIGSGYYEALFTTTPSGDPPLISTGQASWSGLTTPRIYHPIYSGAVSTLYSDGAQPVHLEPGDVTSIYLEGQTIRPKTTSFLGPGLTTAARWWAFKGKIQLDPNVEPEDTIQVARCSWVEEFSGSIAEDGTANYKGLMIDEFLDPRLFGLNYKPLPPQVAWASLDDSEVEGAKIMAAPLAVFGAFNQQPDRAAHTLLRIFLSTGTSVWDEDTTDAKNNDDLLDNLSQSKQVEGLNSEADIPWPAGDYEIADMGLGIPVTMVDWRSFLQAAEDLPKGDQGPMALNKIAVMGPVSSLDMLAMIMQSRGWAFSLIRGKFGIYNPHISSELYFNEDKDFTITSSERASMEPPTVDLRPLIPFDQVPVTYAGNPVEGFLSGAETLQYKARDIGARARSGAVKKEVSAPDLIATEWFVGDDEAKIKKDSVQSWTLEFRQLWEQMLPTWNARPHRLIKGIQVLPHIAQDLGIGSIVRLTDPWPPNTQGTYGLINVTGRVMTIDLDTGSGVATIDVLAEATSPDLPRWSPIAQVIDDVATSEERYNPETQTLYFQDYGGVSASLILPAFVKPQDLDAPDDPASVYLLGFNNNQWSRVAQFTALSVNTITKSMVIGSLSFNVDGFSASFFPRMRMMAVLDPYQVGDDHWTKIRYPRHATAAGLDGTGAVMKKLEKI